ncbi:hypothetical protein [Streptomyces sp. Midd1]|uniref:hypothetical protein n=1 Tax=Streptomyces sp. Midd3 TaxID=3161191 RepID=UPI0034DB29E3
MAKTEAAYELPTEDEVYDHIRGIAPRYRRCAGGDHNWEMTQGTGYTANGRPFKGNDLSKAAWIDCTDSCVVEKGNQRGCGQQRKYQMEYDGRRGRLVRTTDYSYSNRNEELVSPKGISTTGISLRSEMPDLVREDKLRRTFLKLATKGAA